MLDISLCKYLFNKNIFFFISFHSLFFEFITPTSKIFCKIHCLRPSIFTEYFSFKYLFFRILFFAIKMHSYYANSCFFYCCVSMWRGYFFLMECVIVKSVGSVSYHMCAKRLWNSITIYFFFINIDLRFGIFRGTGNSIMSCIIWFVTFLMWADKNLKFQFSSFTSSCWIEIEIEKIFILTSINWINTHIHTHKHEFISKLSLIIIPKAKP